MHLIRVDSAEQLLLGTRFEPADEPWTQSLFRIQLRTSTDSGVILDFSDPRSLRFVAAAIRSLLDAHRDHHDRHPLHQCPTPLHFDCF